MKKQKHGPRYIAIETLCQWEKTGQPADQVMEKHLSRTTFDDPRDRQLAISLVYGVIRWRGYLDWVVEEFSSHPLAKMQQRTLQALRTGLFQLLLTDRIPPSAAVNETVKALKDMKQPRWLTGFVNGILRNVERRGGAIPTPFNGLELPEPALLSHPEWLTRRWKNRYGDALASKIFQANNREADLCLRTNPVLATRDDLLKKLQAEEIEAEPGRYSDLAVKLRGYRGPVATIPGFDQGLFQVQDEAAQLVTGLFGPLQKEKSYLDGCAGLGGKTSHLAQLLPAGSRLTAVEPNMGRIARLQENLVRLRLEKTVTIVEGALDSLLPGMGEKFDGILIDAPCSGLGVIRRHPDIRWNRKEGDLARYQDVQSSILASAAKLLASGGILVYATCSTEPEENEEVIERFLASHPGFVLSGCREVLPDDCSELVDSKGCFQSLPGRDDMDGFFGARIVKKQN